jgi:hypothetical protein
VKLAAGALAAAAAALALGASSAGATNECRSLQVCVPVAGPWVVVPAANGTPRPHVEFQLSCPRGYVVGGLDAELGDPAIDISFQALLGSPVNPGISTTGAAVFVASNVRPQARVSSFRPHIGCIPSSGGGRRVPALARAVAPGHPATRRVWTVKVIAGTSWTVTRRCAPGETLTAATHAVGFYTRQPPTAVTMRAVVASHSVRDGTITARVRSTAAVLGVRAIVQIDAVCGGGQ